MSSSADDSRWMLTLYICGASARSLAAVDALRRICDEELAGRVDLQVVDVHDAPARIAEDHLIAVPTLIKRLPLPARQLVGDLADSDRVRVALDLGRPGDPARDLDRARPTS